jgi:hypothetical protein
VAVYTVGNRRPLRLLRCGPCEGGAPPDLPADIVHEETRPPAIDFTRLGLLPITFTGSADTPAPADWKTRGAGREPGEEG